MQSTWFPRWSTAACCARPGDGNGSRFAMLETIREYAAERLAVSDESTYTRNCHAAFYADVAARSRGVLQAPDRDLQLDRLDSDMANLRAALEWAIQDRDFERAAIIAVGLKDFWRTRSHFAESRRQLDRVLEAMEPVGATRARADVLGDRGRVGSLAGRLRARAIA